MKDLRFRGRTYRYDDGYVFAAWFTCVVGVLCAMLGNFYWAIDALFFAVGMFVVAFVAPGVRERKARRLAAQNRPDKFGWSFASVVLFGYFAINSAWRHSTVWMWLDIAVTLMNLRSYVRLREDEMSRFRLKQGTERLAKAWTNSIVNIRPSRITKK